VISFLIDCAKFGIYHPQCYLVDLITLDLHVAAQEDSRLMDVKLGLVILPLIFQALQWPRPHGFARW
jgi:hypothetical protein